GLVHAGYVIEGRLGVALDIDLGLALADRHEAAGPAGAYAPRHVGPDGEEQENGYDPAQDVAQEGVLDGAGEADAPPGELVSQVGFDPGRDELGLAVLRLLVVAGDVPVRHRDVVDQPALQMRPELAVRDGL